MAGVELQGLRKIYDGPEGDVVGVDDVDISVRDGELLVLVGPSGSGKSTILRCIAGLESVTAGVIKVGETDVTGLEPRERNCAMVFQNFALYPTMTVRGNMSFGLKMSADLSTSEIEARVQEAASLMGIEHLLDNRPAQLSGGEKQRVALGRAIVRDPDVFLLDEPLSNLDAKLRAQMRTELQRIQNELGVTMIYVTHNQTEAMTMGDRIAVLNQGELQQIGTPLECFHAPVNRFVAGFLGEPSMNFFEVDRTSDATGTGVPYPFPEWIGRELDDQRTVVVGIRPEDVDFVAGEGDQYTLRATVDVVEPLGTRKNVYFTLERDESDATYVAIVDGTTHITEGSTVSVRIPPDAIHLFEPESGAAIHNRELPETEKAPTFESESLS